MISRRLLIAVSVLAVAVLGLGVYVLHLERRARLSPAAALSRRIGPPPAGASAIITLFVANDNDGALHREDTAIALPGDSPKRAREILRALLERYQQPDSTHPLSSGADIDDVYLVGENLVIVDANAAFANSHRSGILVEELTLASLVRTLSANLPGVTQMKLLIDGKERATLAGHADLTQAYQAINAVRLEKD